MKQAAIVGERQAVLIDVPDPEPKGDWALVKVHAAPICAEYKGFVGGWKNDCLGHEAAGEVVAVAQPGRVNVGDRVVVMPFYPCGACELCVAGEYIYCEHYQDINAFTGSPHGAATMAQYLLKPDWLLPKIPDGVSYEKASLACCALGPSFNALKTMNVGAFDTLLITGAGAVGFGAIVNARFRGARVILVESNPWRVERARQMGIAEVIDPRTEDVPGQIKALTGGVGVDCALDCSGATPAQRVCIEATRRKGQICFVGENWSDSLPINVSNDLLRKGLTLRGIWHYNLADFPKIMQVIQKSPLINHLISHVLPMSEIQKALEISASNQTAKMILKPWE
jgi:threonine dehydrogenase-like Zn-dependent dehydrogenase